MYHVPPLIMQPLTFPPTVTGRVPLPTKGEAGNVLVAVAEALVLVAVRVLTTALDVALGFTDLGR